MVTSRQTEGRLGNNIQRILTERSMREGDLARLIGMDQGNLNRIKNGHRVPSLSTAFVIARGLGLSVDDVFYMDGTTARATEAA